MLGEYRWPAVVSGALSLAVGLAEAGALAGLAGLLTGDTDLRSRLDVLARPWSVIGLAVVSLVLNMVNNLVLERAIAKWSADRRMDLATAFAEADFAYQRRVSPGSLVATNEQVGSGARVLASDLAMPGTFGRAVVYLVAAFVASWQTALIAGLCGAALMASLRVVSRRTRALNHRVAEDQVALGETAGDMVSSAREIRQLDRWPTSIEAFGARLDRWRTTQLRARWAAAEVAPLFFSGILLIGLATATLAENNSAATLAASGMLLVRALGALQTCQLVLQQRSDALPSLDRVLSMILDLREHRGRRTARIEQLQPDSPTLEFADVMIGYGEDAVLSEVTLTVSGPGAVAILGESGAGKSTMLAAAAGLISPRAGRILINSMPLDDLSVGQVSAALGICSQDTATIEGTVRENLLRRGSAVTDAEIDAVLERLNLAATIRGFGGLDARLGRSFDGLSGGELQRVGMARLILNSPSVWLLDEPTSALDRTNADAVFDEIRRARERHLVLVVTHRPELLELCDTFVLVADGSIVATGPAADMTEAHPFIARMLAR